MFWILLLTFIDISDLEGLLMNKKEKRMSISALIFSIFLFLCAVINLEGGNIGAAICSFGSGIFYLCLFSGYYQKSQKDK